MTREDPATKLRELHETVERVSANLVELEVDSDRRLLAASSLRGESAAEWSEANQALTELWRRQGLLESLLKQADKLRGSRRADELRELLYRPAIELGGTEVPLAERHLLHSASEAQLCSADELLAEMSALFDRVKTVIVRIGGAWQTLTPRLDGARQLLHELNGLAEELGGSARGEVESASRAFEELGAEVTADPLAVDADDVDHLIDEMTGLRDELTDSAALQRGFAARIREAHELLDQIEAAEAEGLTAYEELQMKIAPAQAQARAPLPAARIRDELATELTAVEALAQSQRWRDLRRALEDWTHHASAGLRDAQRARDSSRAPIEARNQMRALLDACQVKAKRLDRLEDPEVAELYARAHETLYNAPTDLELAAQRVRRYQQALNRETLESEGVK
jgi:hypothetical protein